MTVSAACGGLLARDPWVSKRALTVDEYHRMGEAGILTERDRVELIEGELVAMTPIGGPHAGTVVDLTHALAEAVGPGARVSVQNPIRLGETSEPEPDVALLKPRPDRYRTGIPRAEDVLLVVEVADTSLEYDRRVKRPLYARHGIPELWIIDLQAGEIEVYRDPRGDGYASVRTVGREAVLTVAALPGVEMKAGDIIG